MKSYKDLDIYQIAFELALKIRAKTLLLEHPDRFEVGSQIRRSSQGIKDAIVEGYGRKRSKPILLNFSLIVIHPYWKQLHKPNF